MHELMTNHRFVGGKQNLSNELSGMAQREIDLTESIDEPHHFLFLFIILK